MRKLCRNCRNCKIIDDETLSPETLYICEMSDRQLDAEANPPNDGSPCEWVRRPREKMNGAKLSAMRSAFGKLGGRPRGRTVKVNLQINKDDHVILSAYAAKKGMSHVEIVHFLCERIMEQNPGLFPTDGTQLEK